MAHLLQGCMRSHQSKAWCFNLVNFFLFGPSSRVADDDFARLAAAWPSGMPLRVIMHWSQVRVRGARSGSARGRGTRAGAAGDARRLPAVCSRLQPLGPGGRG